MQPPPPVPIDLCEDDIPSFGVVPLEIDVVAHTERVAEYSPVSRPASMPSLRQSSKGAASGRQGEFTLRSLAATSSSRPGTATSMASGAAQRPASVANGSTTVVAAILAPAPEGPESAESSGTQWSATLRSELGASLTIQQWGKQTRPIPPPSSHVEVPPPCPKLYPVKQALRGAELLHPRCAPARPEGFLLCSTGVARPQLGLSERGRPQRFGALERPWHTAQSVSAP